MKSISLSIVVLAAFLFLGVTSLYAQNDWNRDAQVDVALASGSAGQPGVLPPTAGALPATGALPTPQAQGVGLAGVTSAPVATGIRLDQLDHKGEIYKLEGKARVFKKSKDEWQTAFIGHVIEQGDHILTEADSYVGVKFDEHYLNLLRIAANTKVEFRSIEPNNIYLADGSIFNAIESLKPGVKATITTPTVVAAVRGTHYIVSFNAFLKQFFGATIPTNDSIQNFLELMDVLLDKKTGNPIGLPEGKEITLPNGQKLTPKMIKDIDPDTWAKARKFYEQLIADIADIEKKQEEGRNQPGGGGVLPPTSGQFFDPGVLDAGGPGSIGGGENTLYDPLLDTGAGLGDDPIVPSDPISDPEPVFNEGFPQNNEGGDIEREYLEN